MMRVRVIAMLAAAAMASAAGAGSAWASETTALGLSWDAVGAEFISTVTQSAFLTELSAYTTSAPGGWYKTLTTFETVSGLTEPELEAGFQIVNGTVLPRWSGTLTFVSSTKGIDYALGSGYQVTSSGYIQGNTAVPGPVVGAGLPAILGILGFGLWRRGKGVRSAG
jgi:hypothetical protein